MVVSTKRRCCLCGKTFPKTEEFFAWKVRRRGWFKAQCRSCQADYAKKHYRLHRKKYLASAAASTRKKKFEFYSWLKTQACADCGTADFRVLEFDHLRDKVATISALIRQGKWALVWKEVKKCDVVCANCHRIRTAKRGNYFSFMPANV